MLPRCCNSSTSDRRLSADSSFVGTIDKLLACVLLILLTTELPSGMHGYEQLPPRFLLRRVAYTSPSLRDLSSECFAKGHKLRGRVSKF